MHATGESQRSAPPNALWPLIASAALLLVSLLLFWPGIATYDTIVQYQQLLSGSYDDWHPPVMARLWAVLSFAAPGTVPLFILQLTGSWLGLGLLAQALPGRRAIALLAIGATPFLLGWLAIVIKDSQMIGALSLATGIIGHYRLRGRPIPLPALIITGLCLAYATLVRANAAFATVPLAMLLLPRPAGQIARFAVMIAAIPLILLVSQPINHDILKAEDSGVRRTQPIYDLAGIAAQTGDGAATDLDTAAIKTLTQHHCIKPLFWDPLGDNPACRSVTWKWQHAPVGQLYAQLARAAVRHPLAYLTHRFAHLNSTERWLVPVHWPLAAPPASAEPNDLGLTSPRWHAAVYWQRIAGWLTETPPAWPILWVVLALWGMMIALVQPDGNHRNLALALFTSALCQEASFAVISISSDLRYHLWPMLAAALGWLILRPIGTPLPGRRLATLTIAALLLTGTLARLALPTPPSRYAELMN